MKKLLSLGSDGGPSESVVGRSAAEKTINNPSKKSVDNFKSHLSRPSPVLRLKVDVNCKDYCSGLHCGGS